jgi:ABC-2 type transport system ATP-binding protein
VVLTAHLLAQAEEMCDRIALLAQGRLLATGTTAELLGDFDQPAVVPRLEQVYLEKLHARA